MDRKYLYKANKPQFSISPRQRNRNLQNANRRNQRFALLENGRRTQQPISSNDLPQTLKVDTQIGKTACASPNSKSKLDNYFKRFLEWRETKQQLQNKPIIKNSSPKVRKRRSLYVFTNESGLKQNVEKENAYKFTMHSQRAISNVFANNLNGNKIFDRKVSAPTQLMTANAIKTTTVSVKPTHKQRVPTTASTLSNQHNNDLIASKVSSKFLKPQKQIMPSSSTAVALSNQHNTAKNRLTTGNALKTTSVFLKPSHKQSIPRTASSNRMNTIANKVSSKFLKAQKQPIPSTSTKTFALSNQSNTVTNRLNEIATKTSGSLKSDKIIKPKVVIKEVSTTSAVGGGATRKVKVLHEKLHTNLPINKIKTSKLSINLKGKKPTTNFRITKEKLKLSLEKIAMENENGQIIKQTPSNFKMKENFAPNFVTSTQFKCSKKFTDIGSTFISPIKKLQSIKNSKRSLKLNDVTESQKDKNFKTKLQFLHLHSNDDNNNAADNKLTMENTPPQKIVERKTSGGINQEDHSINYLSPFVSVSRGKVSSSKEKEKRNSVYLEKPTSSSKTKNLLEKSLQLNELSSSQLPVEVRRTLEAVRYFRKQLENEIYRLHALCDEWQMYKLENLLHLVKTGSDDMINATIGQTKLLTSKKFTQFKELIDRCEANAYGVGPQDDGSEKTKLVTSVDLEGFWIMLGLQTENLAKRFDNLNRWKANNWNDPDEIKITKKLNNLIKVKKNTKETTTGVIRNRVNNELQEMKRKKYAELHKKQNDEAAPKSQDKAPKSKPKITPSVSANETSVCTKSTSSLSRRRSLSVSPSLMYKKKNKKDERNELRKNVLVTTIDKNLTKNDLEMTPIKYNKPAGFCSEPRSILKTPGTNNGKEKSVIFGRKLHIRKFNFLIESDDEDLSIEETEFKAIANRNKSLQNDKDENSDSYNLRNRKVVKRPSFEIVLPK